MNSLNEQLTFIVPVYNERGTLQMLVEQIIDAVDALPYCILFVDDGSTDGSYELLCDLHRQYPTVDLIRLRRNTGKAAALALGLARIERDVRDGRTDDNIVVTLDADLQDDPKELPRLLDMLHKGNDLVVGWKKHRHDPWHKVYPSRIYNRAVAWIFGLPLHDINCGFKVMRVEVARKLVLYGERHRLIPVFAAQHGFKVVEVPVDHHPRRYGQSKYGFERFIRGALDVTTARFLARYGAAPAHFFGKWGIIGVVFGVCSTIVAFAEWMLWGSYLRAFAFGIVAAGLLTSGMLFVALGLFAELLVHDHVPTSDSRIQAEHIHSKTDE